MPEILKSFPDQARMTIAYICERLEISDQTWYNWRDGTSVPTRRKAPHLATLIGRPEIVDLVEQDRAELAGHRREARAAAATANRERVGPFPTPRTLVIGRDHLVPDEAELA